jgi:hypothetical protein
LTAADLRDAADRHEARGDKKAKGLAEVLTMLAANPEHGSVVIAKPDLARTLAQLLMDEVRNADDPDAVFKRRPVLDIVASIIRVA